MTLWAGSQPATRPEDIASEFEKPARALRTHLSFASEVAMNRALIEVLIGLLYLLRALLDLIDHHWFK
jgi:hypothetical protein